MSTPNLLEQLKATKRHEIVIDRSELETYLRCPRCYHFGAEAKGEDADLHRAANVGIEFHAIMADYISLLLSTGERRNPGALLDGALGGRADYQPELVEMATLTGQRVTIWTPEYIAHEKQYAYRMPGCGPKGEDVLLTCRPDLVLYGREGPEALYLPDWKTGRSKTGFDFQAIFYAVVLYRAHEQVKSVTWQPFFCRFGSWGQRFEYDEAALGEAENIIKRAVMDFLQEDEFAPTPGIERCRWCAYTELCDADRRFPDVDKDPEGFLGAYIALQARLKDMATALKAKSKAIGPIKGDDCFYGLKILSDRPQTKLHKGKPGYIGTDETEDGEQGSET